MRARDPEERALWQRSTRPLDKRTKRELVHERDGDRCLRCGATESLTLDHVRPRSKGGSDRVANLQTLCQPCNNWKADNCIDFRRGATPAR